MSKMQKQFSIGEAGVSVKDTLSGLEWKHEVEDECSFNQACTRYGSPTHDGWRMPTLDELKTLLTKDWPFEQLSGHADMFWSSDQDYSDKSKAHYVEFNGAFTNLSDKSTYGCVRLVRGTSK
jgi:hypothetical protein